MRIPCRGKSVRARPPFSTRRRRRLTQLSRAGWLPHDCGFVSRLPRSEGERRSRDWAHNGTVASGAHLDLLWSISFAHRVQKVDHASSADWAIPTMAQIKPTIRGDCRRRHNPRLARRQSTDIASRGAVAPFRQCREWPATGHRCGGLQLSACSCRHVVSPGSLD